MLLGKVPVLRECTQKSDGKTLEKVSEIGSCRFKNISHWEKTGKLEQVEIVVWRDRLGQIGDCAQQVEMFEGSIKMLGICRTVKHHKTSENVNPRRS